MTIKKYLVHTDTEWCGEWMDYSAYCDDEHYDEMEQIVGLQAYDTYHDFRDFDEEESDDDYNYTITEFEGDDADFDLYEIIYDCRP